MTRARQTLIGLTLAAAITAAFVALHVYGVFVLRWSPVTVALAPLLVAAECWLGAGLFIVAHDAMHGSLAPGRPKLNRAVGQACLAIYAAFPYERLSHKHYAHHRHSGGEGDPDFHTGAPRSFWRWYAKFFREYFGVRQMATITGVFLVYWLVLGAPVLNCLLFWALPTIGSSLQLFLFGTWLPHRHDDEPFVDRHNARTLAFPGWLSLLTSFHFGYHREHHLWPQTPWWDLPRRQRELASPPVKPGLATVRARAEA